MRLFSLVASVCVAVLLVAAVTSVSAAAEAKATDASVLAPKAAHATVGVITEVPICCHRVRRVRVPVAVAVAPVVVAPVVVTPVVRLRRVRVRAVPVVAVAAAQAAVPVTPQALLIGPLGRVWSAR